MNGRERCNGYSSCFRVDCRRFGCSHRPALPGGPLDERRRALVGDQKVLHQRRRRRCNSVGRKRTIKCNAIGTSTPSSTIPTKGTAKLKGSIAYNATRANAGISHTGRSGCLSAYQSTRRSFLTTFNSKAIFFISTVPPPVPASATRPSTSESANAAFRNSNATPGSGAATVDTNGAVDFRGYAAIVCRV